MTTRRRVPLVEFEHRNEPLLPMHLFWQRLARGMAGLRAIGPFTVGGDRRGAGGH